MGARSVTIKGSSPPSVEEGRLFSASLAVVSGSIQMLLRTAAGVTPKLSIFAGVETLGATVSLFEGPTSTDDGAAIPRVNHNRVGSPRVATTLAFSGPTITDDGVPLGAIFVGVGAAGQPTGGTPESAAPFILEAATDYLIRMAPSSGSPDIGVQVVWRE